MHKGLIVGVGRVVGALAIAALFPACQDSGDEIVGVERNELGITKVEFEHRDHDGEQILVVRGVDDDGDQIASATLRTGLVFFSAEPELVAESWSLGTDLTIAVGDHSDQFVSPDRLPHAVREPRVPDLISWVRLPAVADAFEAEAGIRFTRSATLNGEVALNPSTCNSAYFPTGQGNPSECCADSGGMFHKVVSTGAITFRTFGTYCRDSSGGTGCTTNCYYGPCGVHIEAGWPRGDSSSHVFYPTNYYFTLCGYDPTSGSGDGMPTDYNGWPYPGVSAGCSYSGCNADGTRF